MKIMTFNTQHCKNFVTGKIDFQVMADVIRQLDADIVGLNEMHGKGVDTNFENQTEILSDLTGMKYCYFAKAIDVKGKNPYGNAILSKIPIVCAEIIPVPVPAVRRYDNKFYEARCILKARLENGLTVLITHFGLNDDEQENAVKTVLSHIENEKCILMGDFNTSPDNSVLNPIRNYMKDVADLFKSPLFSYPSDNPTTKIDYIFVSRDIKVTDADIPGIVASDHRPHTATVSI